MESSTNSPIGSYHWYHTLMGRILHIGEWLKDKDAPTPEIRAKWGKDIYDSSQELIEGFKKIQSPGMEYILTIKPKQ